MKSVFVMDEYPVVRAGLKYVMRDWHKYEVVAEAGTAAESRAALRQQRCDVLIADIFQSPSAGIPFVEDVRRHDPAMVILIMSNCADAGLNARALRAGASGLLSKRSALTDIKAALDTLTGGGKLLDQDAVKTFVAAYQSDRLALPHESLTNREMQVFQMLAQGKMVGDVAKELMLSAKTVGAHRQRILGKLGLTSTAALIRYAIQHNLGS